MKHNGHNYKTALELVSKLPKSGIERAGSQAAQKWGYRPAGDIAELSRTLGGKLEYCDILEADLETIVVHGPGDFKIVLPNHTTESRDRFTIAHELGHYYLHSQEGKEPLRAGRGGSDLAEWQANWFAAEFLMPHAEFIAAFHQTPSVAMLAHKFGVSAKAAGVRCKVLGLDTQYAG